MGLMDFSLGDVGSLFTGIREALTGKKIVDPMKMAELTRQLDAFENKLLTGQLDINKEEAKSSSIFIAGGRPFIMWGCGFALLYASIFEPIIRFVAQVIFGYTGAFPVIDSTLTMQVLLGLLGLGGMRSYDKWKGTDTKRIGK